MKRLLLAATLIAALAFGAVARAGQPDPRNCGYSKSKAQCAKQAAVTALRRKQTLLIDHHSGLHWDANITCVSKSRKSVLWACSWRSRPTDIPGAATVKFWATSSGWHTRVTIISQAAVNTGYH